MAWLCLQCNGSVLLWLLHGSVLLWLLHCPALLWLLLGSLLWLLHGSVLLWLLHGSVLLWLLRGSVLLWLLHGCFALTPAWLFALTPVWLCFALTPVWLCPTICIPDQFESAPPFPHLWFHSSKSQAPESNWICTNHIIGPVSIHSLNIHPRDHLVLCFILRGLTIRGKYTLYMGTSHIEHPDSDWVWNGKLQLKKNLPKVSAVWLIVLLLLILLYSTFTSCHVTKYCRTNTAVFIIIILRISTLKTRFLLLFFLIFIKTRAYMKSGQAVVGRANRQVYAVEQTGKTWTGNWHMRLAWERNTNIHIAKQRAWLLYFNDNHVTSAMLAYLSVLQSLLSKAAWNERERERERERCAACKSTCILGLRDSLSIFCTCVWRYLSAPLRIPSIPIMFYWQFLLSFIFKAHVQQLPNRFAPDFQELWILMQVR